MSSEKRQALPRLTDDSRDGEVAADETASDIEIADRLHSAAIHLLRRLRVQDQALGLSAPRLSALSVVVFGGPIALSDLADAEQVRLPTISRLVKELQAAKLVRRIPTPGDRRVQRVQATAKGQRVLRQGRQRRVDMLAGQLRQLRPEQRSLLASAAELLEQLTLPTEHPRNRD